MLDVLLKIYITTQKQQDFNKMPDKEIFKKQQIFRQFALFAKKIFPYRKNSIVLKVFNVKFKQFSGNLTSKSLKNSIRNEKILNLNPFETSI